MLQKLCSVPTDVGGPSYAGVVKSAKEVTLLRGPRSQPDDYWRCRRELRMRPVEEGDGTLAVHKYIRENLRQDKKFIDELGPIHVQRIPSGPAAKIKDEVIVTFSTVDARDAGELRNVGCHTSWWISGMRWLGIWRTIGLPPC